MIAVSFQVELGVLQNDLLIPLESVSSNFASSLRKASRSLSFVFERARAWSQNFLRRFAASGIVSSLR